MNQQIWAIFGFDLAKMRAISHGATSIPKIPAPEPKPWIIVSKVKPLVV